MNKNECLIGLIGVVLCGALTGCTTYGQPSAFVAVGGPLPTLEIRAESDFYQPLTPYGRWQAVGAYGRCWIPGRVAADWRPYSEGYWQRTDEGWYWVSDEPWAWATYHYGCWDLSPEYGWFWVPQMQWAPAWVSWHTGGGYIGWTPRHPSGARGISPREYVFVEERHFTEPVRRSTVVVNNTTIINQTVINQAPSATLVERASGRKVQALPVQELRNKTEAAVVAQQRMPATTIEKNGQPPLRSEVQPTGRKAVVAPTPPQVKGPAPAAYRSGAPALKAPKEPAAKAKPVLATPQPNAAVESAVKPQARPAANQPVVVRQTNGQKAIQPAKKQPNPAKPSYKQTQPPVSQEPVPNQIQEPNTADKHHENKAKE